MKRIVYILFLFVAFATSSFRAQDIDPDAMRKSGTIVKVDTIVTQDTVIRTEVITRTDIISRREVIVRKDSLVTSAPSEASNINVAPISSFEPVLKSSFEPDAESYVLTKPTEITVSNKPQEAQALENLGDGVNIPGPLPGSLPSAEEGRYVWVPSSMSDQVAHVLEEGKIKEREQVTFRGDTIPMVLRDRNLGRFNRGLFNYLFIPKGVWSIGVTASYGEFSTSDLEMLDLISDVDFSGHIFAVRPYFSYFIGNNMSVGMRLGYTSGKANIGSFNVDIDEDMSFNLKDIIYKSESYTAAVTFSQYFGITRRGRFGVFNEVELAFSSGSSDFNRPYGGVMKNTHTTSMQAALNFSPGVSVFILDPVSFNVSFGVFGFYLKNEKQMVDGEKSGNRFTSGANFRFNIFNINFGVAINL